MSDWQLALFRRVSTAYCVLSIRDLLQWAVLPLRAELLQRDVCRLSDGAVAMRLQRERTDLLSVWTELLSVVRGNADLLRRHLLRQYVLSVGAALLRRQHLLSIGPAVLRHDVLSRGTGLRSHRRVSAGRMPGRTIPVRHECRWDSLLLRDRDLL